MQNLHLLCLFFDLVSVSTSRVLWCEPKTIRNQFFVLFRKYNKTIIDDIFKVTTKREREREKKTRMQQEKVNLRTSVVLL